MKKIRKEREKGSWDEQRQDVLCENRCSPPAVCVVSRSEGGQVEMAGGMGREEARFIKDNLSCPAT